MKLLAVPGIGFIGPSTTKHRSDLMIVADWVEGTVVFFDQTVSKMDVRKFLCDQSYYQDQAFAMQFVDQVWMVYQGCQCFGVIEFILVFGIIAVSAYRTAFNGTDSL